VVGSGPLQTKKPTFSLPFLTLGRHTRLAHQARQVHGLLQVLAQQPCKRPEESVGDQSIRRKATASGEQLMQGAAVRGFAI
jgi:hypothetical protein